MSDSSFDVEKELKNLPSLPGVYIMRGEGDEILYVGKAKDLSKRVRQYFRNSTAKSEKIKRMIAQISRFEYIVVDSEVEALILENNLIKENSPKYNTLLKDDKTYPYIRVTLSETFPRVLLTRKIKRGRDRYFGPYTSAGSVRDIISLTNRIFRLRSCSRKLPEDIGKERPCLYYHLGQCLAPCDGSISPEEYAGSVSKAIDFISGKYGYVEKYLSDRMRLYSDTLEYEKAIEIRELINEIDELKETQKIDAGDFDDRDIIGIGRKDSLAVAAVFFIRGGRMIGRDYFRLDIIDSDTDAVLAEAFIAQYYSGAPFIPAEIYVGADIDNREVIEEWLKKLRGRSVKIISPKRGQKEKLVGLAARNAEDKLLKDLEREARDEERTGGANDELRVLLGLNRLNRIESYDISNIGGFAAVGSMIVFEGGKPKKSDYRKFRLKEQDGPDDYSSMREVLTRRLERAKKENSDHERSGFGHMPDLILMDGGKGQVNIALSVIREYNPGIPVAGLVKDSGHRTRGLIYDNREISIDTGSECFKLLTRIQDETHRFAIEYHRNLRSSLAAHSVLEEIPGIGKERRRALMRYFKTISAVKNAEIEELLKADKMTRASAESVYRFFHVTSG